MKQAIILSVCLLFSFNVFAANSSSYKIRNTNTKILPVNKIQSTIDFLSKSMRFDIKGSHIQIIKKKKNFAACEIDYILSDANKNALSQSDAISIIEDIAKYYRFKNTILSDSNEHTRSYVFEIEKACIKWHPNQDSALKRIAFSEAEKLVSEQCGFKRVSNGEQFEKARNCRIKITKNVYAKFGLKDPYTF